MKKRCLAILITAIAVCFVLGLIACNGETKSIEFKEESVSVYLSESNTLTPEVVLRPKNAEYTLTSSNLTVATINDDGRSLTFLRAPAIVTVTATSGELQDTLSVRVFKERSQSSSSQDVIKNENYTVVFITNYGSIPDEVVAPGETVAEPDISDQMIGQMLEGWYTEYDFINRYDFDTPVTKDLVLYSKWMPISTPLFNYALYDGIVYITGQYYTYLNYETISFPTTVPDDNMVGSTDISGWTIGGIYSEAFMGKTGLKYVTIPDCIEDIRTKAFLGCTSLQSVTIDGNGLKKVEDYAFSDCTSLVSCTLPDSVITMGASIFEGCSALKTASIPSTITELPTATFKGTGIETVSLDGITQIGKRAFEDCTSLNSVSDTLDVQRVGDGAFDDSKFVYESVKNSVDGTVYLNDQILLYYAIKDGVYTVNVKSTVTYIASTAIYGDTLVNRKYRTTFVFSSALPPTRDSYGIATGEKVELLVPKASYDSYCTDWSLNASQIKYQETINDELTLRVGYSFKNTTKTYNICIEKYNGTSKVADIKSMLLTNYTDGNVAIERISIGAFTKLSTLEEVILCPNILKIETGAFNELYGFKKLTISGDYSNYSPSKTTFGSSAINPLSVNWKIVVPSDKVSVYQNAWTQYSSKIITEDN